MHMSKLKLKPGIVAGQALDELVDYLKTAECALPAVNVIGSHSIVAVLQAAREAKAPVIIQFSSGGAHFLAGKFLDNTQEKAAIVGAVAGAQFVNAIAESYGVPVVLHTDHASKKLLPWIDGMLRAGEQHFEQYKRPLFSSHMLDLSEEPLEENLSICASTLERMARLQMTLEIELGVTGGEEDGVDNSEVDNAKLYTQPADVLAAYDKLLPVGRFTVAASFGNTHGVYKPGNVKLRPDILKNSQAYIQAQRNTAEKPVAFVFHGGSGSSQEEIREAISYGVVKMNIDTDTQWAFCQPVKQYMDEKSAYLQGQLGNPEGADKPNKKQIDPRAWLHAGEKGMAKRILQAFHDLNAVGKFDL
jgi:fructose-bisphosphate aldolase class II